MERWLSGLKRWVANSLSRFRRDPGFESRPLRHFLVLSFFLLEISNALTKMASRLWPGRLFFFMKIGLISDSHDNVPVVKAAVRLFNDANVERIIHAGDYVAPFSVKELLKADAPLTGIFGNNDGEKIGIKNLCSEIFEGPYSIELNNKKITIVHAIEGLDAGLRDKSDVVVYGHTHAAEIKKDGPLIINPGECGGWVNGTCSVAILDLNTMDAEIMEI